MTIPTPVLVDADAQLNPATATSERPLQVEITPILVDGAPLDTEKQTAIVAFETLRVRAGATQVFDSGAAAWSPDVADPKRPTTPLTFTAGKPRPWAGTLVAASLKDLAPTDEVFVRVVAKLAGPQPTKATGGPSNRVKFVSMQDRMQAGLVLDPSKPESATSIEMVLRNSSLAEIGVVRLSVDGGGCLAEISNSSGAKIKLQPNGDIELRPGGSGAIRVSGNVVAQRFFRTAGGPETEVT